MSRQVSFTVCRSKESGWLFADAPISDVTCAVRAVPLESTNCTAKNRRRSQEIDQGYDVLDEQKTHYYTL